MSRTRIRAPFPAGGRAASLARRSRSSRIASRSSLSCASLLPALAEGRWPPGVRAGFQRNLVTLPAYGMLVNEEAGRREAERAASKVFESVGRASSPRFARQHTPASAGVRESNRTWIQCRVLRGARPTAYRAARISVSISRGPLPSYLLITPPYTRPTRPVPIELSMYSVGWWAAIRSVA
jgi:hypothetical protein